MALMILRPTHQLLRSFKPCLLPDQQVPLVPLRERIPQRFAVGEHVPGQKPAPSDRSVEELRLLRAVAPPRPSSKRLPVVLKGAAIDFFRRLLHSPNEAPRFGTYHTVKDEEGNFRSTLRLSETASAAAGLRKREYEGEVGSTKTEAELLAARALWAEPRIREIAANLHPSKKDQRRRISCQEFEARRKAQR
eukprot:s376_g11.t1